MKTRIPSYFIIPVFFFGFILLISNACEKKTECEVVITAKTLNPDTNSVIPGAHIIVGKYDVIEEGFADEGGRFTVTFENEAILDVTAEDFSSIPPLYGETTIRLKAGKTVYKSVFLD